MKRFALSAFSLALLGAAGTAHAESSVTLYGLLDQSIQFVHNATPEGGNLWRMFGGNLQGNRFGLRGAEDLGGGLKAIFTLENGFDINNGRLGQGGRMFGRQAFVGLTGDSWGTVTAGRQFDPVVDMVQPLTGGGYWGSTFATPGDVDNNDNSSRTNSSIKYLSPVFAGFQFAGMYALGGVAGATGSGQTWAAAASYSAGSFDIAAGYIHMDNQASDVLRTGWTSTSDGMFDGGATGLSINNAYRTAKSVGIASVAAQYQIALFTINLSYSNAQYKPDAASAFLTTQKYNVGRVYLGYQLTSATMLGAGYAYTRGTGDASATYNQFSLGADYAVSKRTDFYLVAAYQHARGDQRDTNADGTNGGLGEATASIGSYGNQSNTNSQAIVALGIRHRF
ncbi:porin [Paraburkholderia fynbosensis]|uniref:Outer membrane porin protein n=1 Tax=Paraburkholderia fynbosensis TaxID=1200993 RepID=A0A6J5GVD9_9BURK|nr:porin [Paraburkholderia fynbosensis]CAB3806449.1 Outer membrane porin protein [Paraburkholderia fynbosensis]